MLTRKEIEKKFLARIARDPDFKNKILSDPDATMKEFLEKEIHIEASLLKQATFKAYPEKKNEFILVIPNQLHESRELSQQELQQIASGVLDQKY